MPFSSPLHPVVAPAVAPAVSKAAALAVALACLGPVAAGGAQEGPSEGPPFVSVGLGDVRTTSGSPEKDWILEVNGPGLVVGDFDGDGRHDLVVIDGSTSERARAGEPGFPPRLFLGQPRGPRERPFREAGEPWRMQAGPWGSGGAAADVEGDGDLDLVVLGWGPDRLFHNVERRGFELVSEAGFEGERWSTSAAFLDADRDGDLDLAVVNYLAFSFDDIPPRTSETCVWKGMPVMCGPEGLVPVHDQLYANDGEGRLTEVSLERGFRPERAGFGLGVIARDVDLDGDTDLYVSNDSTPNHLWRNDLEEGFAEIGLAYGVALDANGKEQAGMGIAGGDMNGDGIPELFVTNFSGESNAYYVSGRRGRWRERAFAKKLGAPSQHLLGWGTVCEDFDLDGDLDFAVANGHVYPQASGVGTDTSYAQINQLFSNDGDGTFVVERLSEREASVSRTMSVGDWNDDGAPDLVIADLDGVVSLKVNARGHAQAEHLQVDADANGEESPWLRVTLAGRGKNTQGLGARIELRQGQWSAWREIGTDGGFQAARPAEAFFGLPARGATSLRVLWPSGARTELASVALDQRLTIQEPEGEEPEGDGLDTTSQGASDEVGR